MMPIKQPKQVAVEKVRARPDVIHNMIWVKVLPLNYY